MLTSLNGGENWFGVGTTDKTLNNLSEEIESASTTSQRNKYADEVQKYVIQQGYYDPILNLVQRVYCVCPERPRAELQRHCVRRLLRHLAVMSRSARSASDAPSGPEGDGRRRGAGATCCTRCGG